jgi:hypothetical protein
MPGHIEHKIINGLECKFCNGNNCNGEWRSLSDFGKRKPAWDSLKPFCSNCKKSQTRIQHKTIFLFSE